MLSRDLALQASTNVIMLWVVHSTCLGVNLELQLLYALMGPGLGPSQRKAGLANISSYLLLNACCVLALHLLYPILFLFNLIFLISLEIGIINLFTDEKMDEK